MSPARSSLLARLRQALEGALRRLPIGQGTHPHTLRDAAVARRVARAVEAGVDRGRYAGVQFYVFEGSVALIGTVARQQDVERLASRIAHVRGVTGVVSHLQVVEGILGTAAGVPDSPAVPVEQPEPARPPAPESGAELSHEEPAAERENVPKRGKGRAAGKKKHKP